MRMIAYEVPADSVDDYIQIGESTAIESLRKFVISINQIFGEQYLRSPNKIDIKRLTKIAEKKGFPGTLNDINVLDRSNLFSEWAQGRAPKVNYILNGHDYDMGYYLADGIYPPYPTFVKTISAPQGNKGKHFAKMQESVRKDV
ncbi:uncharacterized protein LOC141706505 [Apium graveolens]|uniref:uncharacterized protein LOC141706505 n=1 Tax=Apium graveolens TaxID=4045 RepID=UPI003D7AB35C